MKDKYIQGIYNEYAGILDQKLADLQVLLTSPVGVGEHGSISEEIKARIKEVDEYQSLVETVQTLFGAPEDAKNEDAKNESAGTENPQEEKQP